MNGERVNGKMSRWGKEKIKPHFPITSYPYFYLKKLKTKN